MPSKNEQLISQYSQSDFTPERRDAFLRDLKEAIEQFNFRQSYRIHPTPVQFRKRFDELRASIRRLKVKLPPADQQNGLFNYIRRLGEAYAAEHGPHPGIEPVSMSSSLPSLTMQLEMPPDFNSAQRLRELIQCVDQVDCWMKNYSEDLVPKSGWSKLGRTHSPELWLLGKQLPAIFDKYFGHWKGGRRARGTIGSRCDSFVVSVLNYAGIKTNKNKPYDLDTVGKYRRRARKPEGFELTTDKLD